MPKRNAKREFEDAESDQEQAVQPTKRAKAASTPSSAAGPNGKDAEGNPYFELSSKRRVTVSKFNKMVLVNIREYYSADGELKPGKKGISLSVDQYKAFLKAVPAINAELRKEGHQIDGSSAEVTAEGPVATKAKKPSAKANIEATSDEESE